jgi:hypothetical protein
MNEARYASLSSGLLARKGSAKPAMRPQGYTNFDDLGWNDMGHSPAEEPVDAGPIEHVPSSIAALTPAPRALRTMVEEIEDPVASEPAEEWVDETAEPSVVAQQRAILQTFDGEEEPEASVVREKPRRAAKAEIVPLPQRMAAAAGKKAAFTLRLDSERHLRLRLACAVTGRSAQQIVTGALDAALAGIPEIEALASRVPAASAQRN